MTEKTEKPLTEKPAAEKNPVPLCKMPERVLKQEDVAATNWRVTAPAGATVEAMLNPASWVHMARRLSPRDRIEVMPEDGAWMADFVVLYKDTVGASLFLLQKWDLTKVTVESKDDYFVKWQSPATKYAVFRASDKTVVKNGFETEAQAQEWKLTNLVKKAA